jgi:hypothetical protein
MLVLVALGTQLISGPWEGHLIGLIRDLLVEVAVGDVATAPLSSNGELIGILAIFFLNLHSAN